MCFISINVMAKVLASKEAAEYDEVYEEVKANESVIHSSVSWNVTF